MNNIDIENHDDKKQVIDIHETMATFFAISASIGLFIRIDLFIGLTVLTGAVVLLLAQMTVMKKIILMLLLLTICGSWRIPMETVDFEQYIEREHAVYCIGVECLQVVKGKSYQPEAEVGQIQAFRYDWNVLWGKGEVVTNHLTIEATNVMGFWFSNETRTK